MKKLHIYLLLPLLSLLLNACLKDNTEAFSTSTALRLDEAAKQSKELLESSETNLMRRLNTMATTIEAKK